MICPHCGKDSEKKTAQATINDAAILAQMYLKVFPHLQKILLPPRQGVIELCLEALRRKDLVEWRDYFKEVATEGKGGWLWNNGNLGMLLRKSTVRNWDAGQYRPKTKVDLGSPAAYQKWEGRGELSEEERARADQARRKTRPKWARRTP